MIDEERLLKLIKTNTAYGIELAIDQYGASVKTICQSILSGYSMQDIEETAVSNAEYQTLYELIDDMKSPDREIFIYRYYDQWTIREIAQRMDLTEKAVENRLVRGRKYLRKQLAYQGMETT